MLEDDSIIADEYGAPAKIVSVELQIEPTRTLSSHTREEPKAPNCVDTFIALEPPAEHLGKPASPDRSLSQYPRGQVAGEVDHGAETVVSPPRAPTPLPPQQSKSGASLLEQEE